MRKNLMEETRRIMGTRQKGTWGTTRTEPRMQLEKNLRKKPRLKLRMKWEGTKEKMYKRNWDEDKQKRSSGTNWKWNTK